MSEVYVAFIKLDKDFTNSRYVISTCENYSFDSFIETGINHPDKSTHITDDFIAIHEAVLIGDKFLIETNYGQNAICFKDSKVTPLENFEELSEFLKSITKTKILTENGFNFKYLSDDESGTLRVKNETTYYQTSIDKKSLILQNRYNL